MEENRKNIELHPAVSPSTSNLSDLARRIGDDLSLLAKDHIELARVELSRSVKSTAADAVAILLGGLVALVGFGMLCVTAVAALAPIWPLWLRLLVMAGVYLVVGGIIVLAFVKKLRGDAVPKLDETKKQSRRTAVALKEQVQHG